jgi:hypothetical protein
MDHHELRQRFAGGVTRPCASGSGRGSGPGTFGFDYGITTIQGVSQRIWDNLAPRSP